MIKSLLLAAALWFLVDMVAYACTIQTIVTDKGLISCYYCPNMPPSCTKV
jgi:hypothetical protein